MPFTVEEFRDLLRILEERPEWRAELRRLVLTDELLTLPELVRALVEAQRRTEEQVGALVEAQRRTEARVGTLEDRIAALAEAQRRTEEQVAALVEAQRRTEARVGILEDHVAALAEAQRRTEERVSSIEDRLAALVEAQRRTETQIAALVEAQHRIEQQIAALTEAQLQADRRIVSLTNDMAEVKGIVLELRYHQRAYAYFAPLIRRTRVLSEDEIDTLLEGAVAQGQLSEAEADEILLADLLLRGRRREDNAEVYLVVEVSWKVDPYDVERAVRRAMLLSRIGLPTIPAVAGKEVVEEAANLAGMLDVWQLTNGQAVPPQREDTSHDPAPGHP